MKKLIHGIVEFREKVRPGYKETFAKLALGQAPDALFVCCSDSRVAPNVFASTDPGDLFVVRNVGNIIPPCDEYGVSKSDESEAAAIEFALETLDVANIIVCGHSECGAMVATLRGRSLVQAPNLRSWLRHSDVALRFLNSPADAPQSLAIKFEEAQVAHNRLSQINVLTQLENLKSYPAVKKRLESGDLALHAWWFDIGEAEVLAYSHEDKKFVPIVGYEQKLEKSIKTKVKK